MANLSTVVGTLRLESLAEENLNEEKRKDIIKKVEEYLKQCFGIYDWELCLSGEWVDKSDISFSTEIESENRGSFVAETLFETTGRWSFANNLRWLIESYNTKTLKELGLDNFRLKIKYDEHEIGCDFIIIGDECVFEAKNGEYSFFILSETNGDNSVKVFDFDLICKSHYIEICNLMEEINSMFDPYELYRTGIFLLSKKELKWKIINLYKYIGKYLIKDMDENTNLNESPEIQKELRLARVELGILEEALKEYQ